MSFEQELIAFKTDAWKGAAMVAGYAERMHENRGTNRLKNHVEVSLCRENIVGKRIIDVGIGTGRGSLPLARDGYDVTGIDVSDAMLGRCRIEAGETPIALKAGDLTALPVGRDEFDSLISLNVAVHFPNWRDALRDWARVVKPNGRLIFDVHSRDHLNAVAALCGCAPDDLLTVQERSDPAQFMLRITAQQIAEAADELGLCIVRLVPYAAIFGGGNRNFWLDGSRLCGYLGDRALSWMAADDRIFEFGSFIEQQIVARLSTHATGRFMAVLEKRRDPGATRDVLAYHSAIAADFASRPGLEALEHTIGPIVREWRQALQLHLNYPKNLALLGMAMTSPHAIVLRDLIVDLAGSESACKVFEAHERQRVDDGHYEFITQWHKRKPVGEWLNYNGVDLGPSLEYELMREALIADYFSAKEQP